MCKMLRELSIRVFAVLRGKVQPLAMVCQASVVYGGSHVMHLCLLLQPLDEGQEELSLQASLVQVIRMPASDNQSRANKKGNH